MVTKGQEVYKIEVAHTLKRKNLRFDFSFSNKTGSARDYPGLFEGDPQTPFFAFGDPRKL
jgi:hypothetical protein